MFSLWPHNPSPTGTSPLKHNHEPTYPGLDPARTIPPAIRADMPGSLRLVDAEANGVTDRGYYGDNEGRVWKVCNIDDDTGEHMALMTEKLMEKGALDVWQTPAIGKKRTSAGLSVGSGRREFMDGICRLDITQQYDFWRQTPKMGQVKAYKKT